MRNAIIGALALSVAAANVSASDNVTTLKINDLQKQLKEQQAQIDALADALEKKGSAGTGAEWFNKTTLGGYGEHHFNHFKRDFDDDTGARSGDDKVDAHRFVLFIGHEYSDTVRFFSELELEHSLAGDGEPGEVELEQAYIEWDFASQHSLVMGQFLIPVGMINETHEPDTFYGVERNTIEKNIIPATWWETGVMVHGEIGAGFSYNLAIHSGLNIDGDDTGLDSIRSGRQKSAKATAEDLAYTGRVKYTGVKGLEVGLAYQHQQDISQGSTGDSNRADLIVANASYNIGAFGVKALVADWEIDGEIPKATGQERQKGFYLEGSYKVLPALGVFARYGEYDTKAGDSEGSEVDVQTFGANYWLEDTVVIKVDYQDVDAENNGGADSINLGIGWSF